jgi:hypothetical protein
LSFLDDPETLVSLHDMLDSSADVFIARRNHEAGLMGSNRVVLRECEVHHLQAVLALALTDASEHRSHAAM